MPRSIPTLAGRKEPRPVQLEVGQRFQDTRFQGGTRVLKVLGLEERIVVLDVTVTVNKIAKTHKERVPVSSVGPLHGHTLLDE